MKHYYRSKWEWFCESDNRCYWRSPGGNAIGTVDLRSNTQSGKSGGIPDGFGVFAYAEPQIIEGAEYLGTDSSVAADLIWQKLTVEADPTGKDAPKPLTGRIGKEVAIYLAGEKLKSEGFTPAHRKRTVDVFQADYRKNVDIYPKALLQKWVGAKMKEIYGEQSDEKAELLVPVEHKKKGEKLWRKPATTIGDTFVDTNGVDLEAHTATGTGGGFSWSKLAGNSMEIQSNKAQRDTNTGHGDRDYRADSDLSTDDMYSKATVGSTGSDFDCAVSVRFSSSARTHYQTEWGNGFRRISKFVAGSHSVLQSDGSGNSVGDILECRVDGTTIQSFRNGAQVLTNQTDTDITGHVRAGLSIWHDQTTWDDWSASDLSTDLTVSVSDTVTITENIKPSYSLPSPIVDTVMITEGIAVVVVNNVSVFDAITVSEAVQISYSLPSPIIESVTITESVTILIPTLKPSISDNITVTEGIQISYSLPSPIFDTVTITEAVTIVAGAVTPSVSDLVTITEGITVRVESNQLVFDTVTITEGITVRVASNQLVFDAVTITEGITMRIVSSVSVSDLVTIAEGITVLIPILITSVSDNVTLTEGIQISYSLPSPISDTVTITEGITVRIASNQLVFDTVTITEDVTMRVISSVSVSDLVTVSEQVTILIPILPISVSDQITITESIVTGNVVSVEVFDAVTITESVSLVVNTSVSVFDSVTITENLAFTINTGINLFDSVTVSEDITVIIGNYNVDVFDSVTVSEAVTVQGEAEIVYDEVTVSEDISLNITVAISVYEEITVTDEDEVSIVVSFSVNDSVAITEDFESELKLYGYNTNEYRPIGDIVQYDRANGSVDEYQL